MADVPLLIPEVNADHLKLLEAQAASRDWQGRIVTNPNCATVVLAMALAPLRQFGLKTTMITTLQAISGAGYPGVASWDILGNVIPHIGGEEEKIETETKKILGCFANGVVSSRIPCASARRRRGCRCRTGTRNRFPSGSTSSRRPRRSSMPGESFSGRPQELDLPSAPQQPIVYLTEPNRPQPILDVNRDGGMTVTSAGCVRVRCSTTSSSRSATTRSAAPPAPRS